MFLAIDIGNTHTVLGVYQKSKLISHWRIASSSTVTEKELAALNQTFFVKEKIDMKSIDGVGISSVVPELTETYSAMSKHLFHRTPMIVSSELDLGIHLQYDHPAALGADRICDAIAGYKKYGGPLIIIDFGTATTYDVVGTKGDFLGGVIAPGIATAASALHQRTAKLPNVELQVPPAVLGTNTTNSIQSGILFGALDAAAGMIARLQKEIQKHERKNAAVIATGGFSEFMAEHSSIIRYVEPFLVLDGIRLITERAGKKQKC
ncbi:MAG TPA: type III pantothenate kinase [Bacteroidota bacterium]|nr:type III pantothenate kinase [Bacteroidota bacterium]